MPRSAWVVSVSYEDEDPEVYGPYTERQAERVKERLVKEAEDGIDRYGGNHHPHAVRHAIAYPLSRYDSFLTAEEKREMRAEVREGNKQYNGVEL